MNNKIESSLEETRMFSPSKEFVSKANITNKKYQQMLQDSQNDYEGYWAKLARENISWHKEFTKTLNVENSPNYKWFEDGTLNVSYNCLDRYLDICPEKTAIIFHKENNESIEYTYKELTAAVCRFANGLKTLGVGKGDRVIIYMPMIPQGCISMLACARIGAIHSVVFGGFSANALKDRIDDVQAKVVITADGGIRAGGIVELKKSVDEALSHGSGTIQKVIVLENAHNLIEMDAKMDIWWDEVEAGMPNYCDPEIVEAEHPLFVLYTSGSTGKPKGIQHSSAGYLLHTKLTNEWVFDLKQNDIFWCTADIGWITGHSYVVYGPLANGKTIFMYEGVPTYPDAGRWWELIEKYGITVLYTAPTAIRALMKFGDEYPNRFNLDSIRLLGTVGEPINPEAWMWYHKCIGKENTPIVDTWWQTETGANMITPLPGITTTKPGSCTKPLPGIDVAIVDNDGNDIEDVNHGGALVIKKPWPSMIRTIWGDNQRFKDTYFSGFGSKNYYVVGDSARRDSDGYYWIMGRLDDVLNVSGHRLGTMEIESSLVANMEVTEAAVVPKPHNIKGEAIVAFVVVTNALPVTKTDQDALIQELRNHVAKDIGAIAKPDDIYLLESLPKTRSGKIMRRLLKSVAKGEALTQDVSTLENPQFIEQFKKT